MYSERRLSRIAALLTLFTLKIRPSASFSEALDFSVSELPRALQSTEFAQSLIEGVQKNISGIEEIMLQSTKEQSLKKIDPVTRTILEIAIFEIKFSSDAPFQVVINEAIEIAKEYGKDSSPSFVNGILAQIVK